MEPICKAEFIRGSKDGSAVERNSLEQLHGKYDPELGENILMMYDDSGDGVELEESALLLLLGRYVCVVEDRAYMRFCCVPCEAR
jgi:hypothetical protein